MDLQVRLAELSVTGSLRSTKKLAQHRGPAHKMTLLPDSPYIVLSAGEDGQVFSWHWSWSITNLFICRSCPLISESPNLTRYCFYGMKKTKRYAWQWTSHSKVLSHFSGTNIQHPLFPHQLPLILHLWQVKCRSLWLAPQALLLPGISLSGSLIEDILGLRPGGAAR